MEHYRCCGINRYSSPRREENSFVSYILPPGGHVIQKGVKIEPPSGIAGVEAIKKKIAQPVGSLTQLGTIRLGKRTERRVPKIQDFVPLASLDSLVFGGWDIYEDNCYESAVKAGVLDKELLEAVRPQIEKIKPWRAVFSHDYVKRLQGPNVKSGKNKMDLARTKWTLPNN